MRIFVAGATGVIGRRVVPLLVGAGHQVTALGRSPAKRDALTRAGAAAIDVSLFDAGTLARAMAGHDAVVNLATHIPRSATHALLPGAWRENDRVRREGSAALVDAALAAGVRRFVQESFAPMHEDGGDVWIDERWPVRPAPYNRSTLDAERSAERFAARGGASVVLRFALFYGPDSGLLRDMIGVVRRGWSPLPGPPNAFVSSIAHDDAASAVTAALTVPAGVYEVADDEPVTRGVWAASLAEALGTAPPRPLPRWLTRFGGATVELLSRSQRVSNRKLRDAARWAPVYPSVREGWAHAVGASAGGAR